MGDERLASICAEIYAKHKLIEMATEKNSVEFVAALVEYKNKYYSSTKSKK